MVRIHLGPPRIEREKVYETITATLITCLSLMVMCVLIRYTLVVLFDTFNPPVVLVGLVIALIFSVVLTQTTIAVLVAL